MAFGGLAGIMVPIFALTDKAYAGLGTAIVAFFLTVAVFVGCALALNRPGYSAVVFLVTELIFIALGSAASTPGLLLLIAAPLAGIAAFAMRRSASRVT